MIKKILIFSFGTILLFSACTKEKNLTGPSDKTYASVSITNANASGKIVDAFIDQVKINNASTIAANGTITGTYIGITPGTHNILVRDISTVIPAIDYLNSSITVAGGNAYSYFIYDTLTAGKFKGILLNSDRIINYNTTNTNVRFLNLSPKSPLLDFILVRREAAINKDSVVLYSSVPYLGNVATPDITALSAFKPVLGNAAAGATAPTSGVTDYIARVKLAGTNTVVASTLVITLIPGRNYTFFARGIYPAVIITTLLSN
ncbi:MAG: DUF4397 domain-containing protein [Ferruginibacter sp.]